jgi:hypothetical protein
MISSPDCLRLVLAKAESDKAANLDRIKFATERQGETQAANQRDVQRWCRAYFDACRLIDLCNQALAKSSRAADSIDVRI